MSVKSDIKNYGYARHWYRDANRLINNLFGDDSYLFIDILSALSPQMSISKNWRYAVKIFTQHKAGQQIDYEGLSKNHKPNLRRALNREQLSGNKVKAFAENLKGNLDGVTIDTWMLWYFKWFDTHPNCKTPHNNQYQQITNKIRQFAKRYNLYPAELQAILWTAIRDKEGKSYKDFTKVGNIPF